MPVPNPTPRELAEAGALMVGINRRADALLSAHEERQDIVRPVMVLAALAVLTGCVSIFVAPASARATAMTGALALALAGVSLLRSMVIELPVDLRTRYRADELAALVGYVEASHDGTPRVTELGKVAVITYLSWREPVAERSSPGAPSDPVSEHRPLEAI